MNGGDDEALRDAHAHARSRKSACACNIAIGFLKGNA